jgi:hypothetical protein
MIMDVTVILAALPIIAGVGAAAARVYVRSELAPLKADLATHKALDEVTHATLKTHLQDVKEDTRLLNVKMDRLIDKLL